MDLHISRRNVLRTGAVAGLAAAAGGAAAAAPAAATPPWGPPGPPPWAPPGRGDETLTLVNGKIHTMDDHGTVAKVVSIRDGRIVSVGHRAPSHGPGNRVINLRGRTVIPGLIESHTHYVSLANRPGYHVAQLELASSIAEVQEMLAARRAVGDVPEGAFITSMGGWNVIQWAEQRLPTRAELDEAVSDRPVFLYHRGFGPAVVNSLGKQFFEAVDSPLAGPVPVGDDGSITGAAARAALYHLRVRQTFEDQKRSAVDAMSFSAQVGITALLDQTLVAVANGPLDPQPGHGLPTLDHYRMYDGWLAVHRDGGALVRLQINFLHNQGYIPEFGGLENQLPELRERLKNQFPFFGDDMLRTGGIGEWAAPFALEASNPDGYAVWFEAQRLVAQAGWRNENSQGNPTNIQQVVEAYEAMDAEFGITDLRWGLQHGDFATEDQLARLRDLNVGLSTSGFRWQNNPSASGDPAGPLFPQLVASGINLGLHEDGVHIAPHNPFFALHYATTGLNWAGEQINPGQQISRQQALHLYTRGNAWYLNREDDLGSIEPGKQADLLVLDRNYFTVSDDEMRRTRPVLTIVGGRVVYDAGVL